MANGIGRVGWRNFVATTPTTSAYLLDNYGGAAVAYSLRKLSSTYTGSAIRVRRYSDNSEQNIGFDTSGNLDTTSLLAFAGSSSVLVTTWYDQSGNNNNSVQTSALSQPKIIDVGNLNTLNGKPSIKFSSNRMVFTEIKSTGGMEIFCMNNFNTVNIGGSAWDLNSPIQAYTGGFVQDFAIGAKNSKMAIYTENNNSVSLQTLTGITATTPYIYNGYGSTTSTGIGFNNSNYFTGAATRNDLIVRALGQDGGSLWFDGNVNEIIVYPTVQPTNRSNINNNMNSYYSVYPTYTSRTAAFATATGITDTTVLNALNTFDTGLISNGLDTKMKALYPFVGGTANTHKYNFMDARDVDAAFRLTFSGGWIHSSTGAKPNGINTYANTFFNPVAQSIVKTNFGFSQYIRTNNVGYYCDLGVVSSNSGYIYSLNRFDTNSDYSRVFDNGSTGGNYLTRSDGMFTTQRNGETSQYFYRNGNQVFSKLTLATGPDINLDIYLAARNLYGNGNPGLISNRENSLTAFHDALTSEQVSILNMLTQAFQTTLGRQV